MTGPMLVAIEDFMQISSLPKRGYETDAGYDLTVSKSIDIRAGELTRVEHNIRVALPPNTWGMLVTRSSTPAKGLNVVPAVIDNGYRGPLHIQVWNVTDQPVYVREGERLAQLIVMPMITPDVKWAKDNTLPPSDRGENGFGSTGG